MSSQYHCIKEAENNRIECLFFFIYCSCCWGLHGLFSSRYHCLAYCVCVLGAEDMLYHGLSGECQHDDSSHEEEDDDGVFTVSYQIFNPLSSEIRHSHSALYF